MLSSTVHRCNRALFIIPNQGCAATWNMRSALSERKGHLATLASIEGFCDRFLYNIQLWQRLIPKQRGNCLATPLTK